MPPFLALALSKIGGFVGPALRMLAPIVIVAFVSYMAGKNVCKNEYQRKASQEAATWSELLRVGEAQAYKRGLQAAQIEARNERVPDEVVREAQKEDGADNVCISEDTLARIRALQ